MINYIDILAFKLFRRYFKKKNIEIKVIDTQEELTIDEFESKLKKNKEDEEFEKYINQYW